MPDPFSRLARPVPSFVLALALLAVLPLPAGRQAQAQGRDQSRDQSWDQGQNLGKPPETLADNDPRMTPVVRAVQMAAPAVVNITAIKMSDRSIAYQGAPLGQFLRELYGIEPEPRQSRNLGSGVIIDGKRGLVVTNAHVVADARQISVRLMDGREFSADLVGSDLDFDLAVLRLENGVDLPQIKMAPETGLYIGETVIAIGNPYGYAHTVTTGVVSALNRSVKTPDGLFTDFIQTDAAINPGNSGGPLLNIVGELIGITTAIQAEAEGIGFAIPISKARRVVAELLAEGRITPVWLGISGQNVDQRIANYFGLKRAGGVLITEVHPGSPADQAGLKPGDLILAVGATPVENKVHYLEILKNVVKDSPLQVKALRDNAVSSLTVRPAPMDRETMLGLATAHWGVAPSPQPHRHGVLVAGVKPGSPAERLELQPGDILVQIGSLRLHNVDDFIAAYQLYRMSNSLLVRVARNGRLYYAKMILGGGLFD